MADFLAWAQGKLPGGFGNLETIPKASRVDDLKLAPGEKVEFTVRRKARAGAGRYRAMLVFYAPEARGWTGSAATCASTSAPSRSMSIRPAGGDVRSVFGDTEARS